MPAHKKCAFLEGDVKQDQLVGWIDGEYHGPVARVSFTKDWLYIITDDYEGCAMLNIEALPALRRALSRIAKLRKAPSPPHP